MNEETINKLTRNYGETMKKIINVLEWMNPGQRNDGVVSISNKIKKIDLYSLTNFPKE
jgi:hypothetical protein